MTDVSVTQNNIAFRVYDMLDAQLFTYRAELSRVQQRIDYGPEDQRWHSVSYRNTVLREISYLKEVLSSLEDHLKLVPTQLHPLFNQ